MRFRKAFLGLLGVFGLVAAACGVPEPDRQVHADVSAPTEVPAPPQTDLLAGMPPPLDAGDVYAATRPGQLSEAMDGVRNLVYVPNSLDDTVSVIDPNTFKVVDTFPGGNEPQHVVPSYDLKTLYVAADEVPGGTLTPVDPKTGKPGVPLQVQDPYNLYFTPDGSSAIVVAEYYKRLDFYDPHTWQRQGQVSVPDCAGVNHMDFTADGKLALVTCEFANRMIVLDVAERRQVRTFQLDQVHDGMPQDSRLAPDGSTFYVADMMAGGVYLFDGAASRQIGFVPTGKGAHGIYFSRDSRRVFVANRGEGSVSVLDSTTHQPIGKWQVPGGGSPDMGGVSADGKQLWLSGRYHNEVYVFDTDTGHLLARIRVGAGPHGLTYMPQPGRYSLGHTGNLR
ncbi:YncE family protein [Saccharopolyspora sp. WRP15-2]|uniref:YncE family protein n=1 Tax=Saccharopolyspora oryzae TaxID=2997343 RepID=A0ABT4UV10_9PSEU|nr:YncE family protein [Saccharopolyspora oryzae]MDA3625538.1 YncE family protein [Saccharopolyspora oryzae]